jgi:hypothetical protein
MVTYYDSVFVLGGNSYNIGNRQYNFTTQTWTVLPALNVGYGAFGCALIPGIDFMNLHFGRIFFGQILIFFGQILNLILKILTKL